jgi:hypothetical protein
MKSFRFTFSKFAVAVAGMILLCACPDKDPIDTLTVSKTQFTFEADDTEAQTLTVTTSASTWSAYSSDSWLKASKSENTLSISVQNYTDSERSRKATITIEAGDVDPVTISVTQNARTIDNLSIDPVSLSYETSESGDKSVNITTSAPSWDATVDASWVSLRKQGTTLMVSAAENTGPARNANITITAGNAPPVTLPVTQAQGHITYNKAYCEYLGDDYGKGTAVFLLHLYDYDLKTGIVIQGHCALPSIPSNFRVATGTYNYGTGNNFGRSMTFAGGEKQDTGTGGTCVYDFYTEEFIFIDGGTFTIEASGNNNTVTTNFSGKDYKTGASVNNIQYRFTGQIEYYIPDPMPIINGTYSANGTPDFLISPGDRTWSGRITTYTSGRYYTISNFGNDGIEVRLLYMDESNKIIMDGVTKVAESTNSNGYFRIGYKNGESAYILNSTSDYTINYNASTRTLDFSGTVQDRPAMVGVVGYSKSTNEPVSVFTDLYTNLKLVVTSTSSAPQAGRNDIKKHEVRRANAPERTNSNTGASIGEKFKISRESLEKTISK